MRLCSLLLALVSACASANSGPTVAVTVYGDEGWSADDVAQMQRGAEAWDDLGFLYVLDPYEALDMKICPRDWSIKDMTECKLRIGVTKVPGLAEKYGAAALSDRAAGTIEIDAKYSGLIFRHLSAHEFGHMLLNTGNHLPAGVYGIMMQGSDALYPSEADWALACVSTGICVGD